MRSSPTSAERVRISPFVYEMSYYPSSHPQQIPRSALRTPYGVSPGRYGTSTTAYPPAPTYRTAPPRPAPTSFATFEVPPPHRRQALPHGQRPVPYHPQVSYMAPAGRHRTGSHSYSHSLGSTHPKNSHHSHSSKRRHKSGWENPRARAERDLNDRATLGDTLFMIWNTIRDMMPVGRR
jgi:hypothetical protein